jgi:hypothetical protein
VVFLPPIFFVSCCTVVKISGSLVSDASLSARLGGLLFVLARLEHIRVKKSIKNTKAIASEEKIT